MKSSYSDLIANLRSIHQTLFLTSIALLIALVLAKPPDNIAAAKDELTIIEGMTSEENWNPLFLEAFYQQNDNYSFLMGDEVWHHQFWEIEYLAEEVFNNTPVADTHTEDITAPTDIFIGWDSTMVWDTDHFFWEGAGPYVQRPNTIAELAQIWDKARNTKVLTIDHFKNYAYIQRSPDFPVEKVEYQIRGTETFYSRDEPRAPGYFGVFRTNIFRLEDIAPEDQDLYGLSHMIENDYFEGHKWKIWIPAITRQGRMLGSLADNSFDASKFFCEKIKIEGDRCQAPFEQAFPNLFVATKEYQNLPFDDVAITLERQGESQLQNFNLLGFSIPVTLISSIGSALLVILQIYFYLHLHNLGQTSLENNSPAWIGVFRDKLSRVLSIISSAVLPTISIFMLTLRIPVKDLLGWNLINILFCGVSVVISAVIIRNFSFFWLFIDHQDYQIEARIKRSKLRRNRNS